MQPSILHGIAPLLVLVLKTVSTPDSAVVGFDVVVIVDQVSQFCCK
jgi:hypothetical protein